MIETTLPTNLFDQFSSLDEEDSIDYNDEIRSILVYIGLTIVILFILFVIFSLICKCVKMFDDKTITTKKKMRHQRRQVRLNSLTSRQTSMSSVASSSLLISYHTNKSLTKSPPSSSTRTFQCQKQDLLLISTV